MGGHELVSFEGILKPLDNGSYYSFCDLFESSINIIFADDGFYVSIISSNDQSMYNIEGFYSLESELNLNNVG